MEEFSKIVRDPLFDITRSRMATHVEHYLIQTLDLYDEIVEKRPGADEIGRRRSLGAFEGAFVFTPTPGLYEKIAMYDFTSMYPSVIISYNLSKSTLKEDGTFCEEKGFNPKMLSDIIDRRKKYKKELAKNPESGMARARSNAYKLLANASYGYQAFFGARYYSREAASSTTRLAREHIHKAIKDIEDEGHTVLLSDTDSIAFLRSGKTKKEILDLMNRINEKLPGIMELDFEGFFKRGIFVTNRGKTSGAKKKYALLDSKDKLKIRGFETVRRDWCGLARKLQSEILGMILREGNEKKAVELVKKTVGELKERKIGLSELMVKTKLKKPIESYISKGPHVIAAEKLKAKGVDVGVGTFLNYYIGEISGKAKRVGDRVFLEGDRAKYDIDYYLNNQVLPAVENIFDVFGVNVTEMIEGSKQETLF